ncbi:MAG: type II toxin-antitoxin system VapC family toxin [Burkholderiales bacterium]|nr:type II toxin-antitoxin system VapC family toxin [Burkholderiales bacterium]
MLLLDTHLLLWAAGVPERLPAAARRLLEDPDQTLAFSAASLWEIVIKRSLKERSLQVDPRALRRGLLDGGYREIPILSEHALAVERLPLLHKDPFDRLLIAQAEVEGATLLTSDKQVAQYPGAIRKV